MRRLEGSELRPWRDARGVHRFAAADVDRVLERRAAGLPSAASDGLAFRAQDGSTGSRERYTRGNSPADRLARIQRGLLEALEPLTEREVARLPGELVNAILSAIETK